MDEATREAERKMLHSAAVREAGAGIAESIRKYVAREVAKAVKELQAELANLQKEVRDRGDRHMNHLQRHETRIQAIERGREK